MLDRDVRGRRDHAVAVRVDDVLVDPRLRSAARSLLTSRSAIAVWIVSLLIVYRSMSTSSTCSRSGAPRSARTSASMTSGSHSRALSIVVRLSLTTVGGRGRRCSRSLRLSIFDKPYASRVARMLRAMYGPFLRELVRLHPELLHHRRVDRADHDRHEAPQPDRDDRQDPPAPPDVPEEQRRGHDRDEDQQVERGQLAPSPACSPRRRPRRRAEKLSSKRAK